MSMNSVIEHRANSHFIKIQEDYLVLCKGDHCQALILDILEEWTNTKRKTKGQSLYIYMTYPQWITALYGAYGRNRIMEALADLEAQRLIEKRPYRLYGKETFEYRLNTQVIHTLISALPEKKPDEVLPDLHAFKKGCVLKQTRLKKDGKNASPVPKRTGDAFKKGRNVESLTQNTNNIHPEEAAFSNFPSSQNEQTAATLNNFSFETLTEEEIALLQAYRQRTLRVNLPLSKNLGGGEAEQSSKQAESVIQADEQSAADGVLLEVPSSEEAGVVVEGIVQRSEPIGPPPVSENVEEPSNKHHEGVFPSDDSSACSPEGVLTAEQIVDYWEGLRKQRYILRAREAQVQAAHDLLLLKELPLPLSLEVLKQIYEMNYDAFWQKTFGAFHLTHLLMLEKKSGELRISSLMHRLPKPGSSSFGEKKVNYNEVVAMSEEEREEYKRQQQAKYAVPGLDREAFMKLSPAERIAAFKALQVQQAATV